MHIISTYNQNNKLFVTNLWENFVRDNIQTKRDLLFMNLYRTKIELKVRLPPEPKIPKQKQLKHLPPVCSFAPESLVYLHTSFFNSSQIYFIPTAAPSCFVYTSLFQHRLLSRSPYFVQFSESLQPPLCSGRRRSKPVSMYYPSRSPRFHLDDAPSLPRRRALLPTRLPTPISALMRRS